jgi:hypothetical protein
MIAEPGASAGKWTDRYRVVRGFAHDANLELASTTRTLLELHSVDTPVWMMSIIGFKSLEFVLATLVMNTVTLSRRSLNTTLDYSYYCRKTLVLIVVLL